MAGGRDGGADRELRLDWPDDAPGRSDAPGRRVDHRLAWADESGSPAAAAPRPEAPPADSARPPRLRVRTRRSDESAPADVHAECRTEIQRLRDRVEELERQIAVLAEDESPA